MRLGERARHRRRKIMQMHKAVALATFFIKKSHSTNQMVRVMRSSTEEILVGA